MKLVGNYLSHFVRRVAIPMHIYSIDFELVQASVATDQATIQKYNKLARIPSLILDDDQVLADSHFILEELDQMAPAGKSLAPQPENRRNHGQVLASLTGTLDKTTAWFYEVHRRPKALVWEEWAEHLRAQLAGGVLQVERSMASNLNESPYLFENRLTHADIAVGLAYPLANKIAPERVNESSCPLTSELSARMNNLEAFKATLPGS